MKCVLSFMVVLGLCAVAHADWINMNLSNGDFSTPGTLGALGQSVSISANVGTQDNGKLFQDWKALGGGYTNTAQSDASGFAKIVYGGGTGKTRTAHWVHDAMAGVTIEAKVYRLDYGIKIDNYDYKAGSMFLWGDTDINDVYTWAGADYFSPYGTHVAAEYPMGQLTPYGSWYTRTLFWDNTGSTTWTPDVAPGNPYLVVHTGAGSQHLGEHLRVGFYSSKYSNGGTMNIDNVVVSYEGVAPEPATLVLLAMGAVGLAGSMVWRRRK